MKLLDFAKRGMAAQKAVDAATVPRSKKLSAATDPALPVRLECRVMMNAFTVPINCIVTGPQPRTHFDEEAMQELIASVKDHGIRQPLEVRDIAKEDPRRKQGKLYELVSGERRLRAAQRAKLTQVPVLVQDVGDIDKFVLQLVENLQRENLSPMDEARGYERLIESSAAGGFGMNTQMVADKVHKSLRHVQSMLQLLQVPEPVKEALSRETITADTALRLQALPEKDASIALQRLNLISEESGGKVSVREARKVIDSQRGLDRPTQTPAPEETANEKDLIWLNSRPPLDTNFMARLTRMSRKTVQVALTTLPAAAKGIRRRLEYYLRDLDLGEPTSAPRKIVVEASRVLEGGDIHKAYSGDVDSNKANQNLNAARRIRQPFTHDGKLWTSFGGSWGKLRGCDAWELVPRAEWKGRTFTQAELFKRWDRNEEERGNDDGLLVLFKGKHYVCKGPPVTFEQAAGSIAPKAAANYMPKRDEAEEALADRVEDRILHAIALKLMTNGVERRTVLSLLSRGVVNAVNGMSFPDKNRFAAIHGFKRKGEWFTDQELLAELADLKSGSHVVAVLITLCLFHDLGRGLEIPKAAKLCAVDVAGIKKTVRQEEAKR